jgi:hypothetical protein
MVFPVQHEIASGKKRPRNDSLNSYLLDTYPIAGKLTLPGNYSIQPVFLDKNNRLYLNSVLHESA